MLVIRILDLGLKQLVQLHYVEDKIKLNSIIYQVESEDRSDWEWPDLKIWLDNILEKPDRKDN